MSFFLGTAEGLIGTFFPIVFLHKGGSQFMLGMFTGIVALGGTLQMIWGNLIERYQKPRRIVLGAQSANVIATGLMAISPEAAYYGMARVMNAMDNTAHNNADNYIRSAYFPAINRGKVGNIFMGLNLAGVGISVFVAGFVYDAKGYGFAWVIHLIAGGLFLAALLLYTKSVPEFDIKHVRDEQLAHQLSSDQTLALYSKREQWQLFRRSKGLLPFIIGYLIFNFGVAISGPFFIVDLNARWGLSGIELAILLTFNSIMQVLVIFLVIPVIDFIDRKVLFSISIGLATIPAMGMVVPPELAIRIFSSALLFWMVVYFISGIGWGLVNSLLLTLIIDYVHPKIRATITASFGTLQAISVFVGSILAGFLAEFIVPNVVWIFALSLCFRVLGLLVLLLKTPSPAIPMSDFSLRRQIFMSKLMSTFERGMLWIPGRSAVRKRK